MKMLCCRTRGNTAAAGKAKIYVVSGPEGRDQYMDAVVRILLQVENAAIYYDDGTGEHYYLNEENNEFQIIAAIITEEFLRTDNPAKQELLFAIKNNIPVFPFTFEKGVDILFDQTIGHYQCIFAGQQTGTEKNFYQKLYDAISDVVQPEELKQDIYDKAFDLFLFISYRKIDRKYVNDYVKFMHKIPALQGVGYWYDEDLSMGGDYNEEIDIALRGADAVLLIVTPNVLAEGNYVKRIEYQNAVSYGKPILAVELAPTDRGAFIEAFPEVDYYISLAEIASSEAVFSNLIKLQGKPPRSKYSSYLLGQAYLYGTGVEFNSSLGQEILSGLAENGYVPAIEAMVDLYKSRTGASLDPEALLRWKKELVLARQYLFEQSQERDRLLDYLHSLYEYGNEFFMHQKIEEAKRIYLMFLEICENYQLGCEDMIKVCYDLGKIYYSVRDYEKAQDYFERQMQLTEQYLDIKGELDLEGARSYFTSQLLLNDIQLAMENYGSAEKGYKQAERIAKKNYELFPCNGTLRDLKSAESGLGRLYTVCAEKYGQGNLLQIASEYYTEAAEIGNNIYKERMDTHNLMNLIQDFIDAGDAGYAVRDYLKAKKYYNKSTHAFLQLKQKDLVNILEIEILKYYAPNMDRVYLRLFEIYNALGDMQSAEAAYTMYQQIMQVLGTDAR